MGILGDLSKYGMYTGFNTLGQLLTMPLQRRMREKVQSHKSLLNALLGGLATTPAGPEHVAGAEAIEKLTGTRLPTLGVPTSVPTDPAQYEAQHRVTIPPPGSVSERGFVPPPTTEMRQKIAGLSPGSLDQLMTRLGIREGKSLEETAEAKRGGMSLMEKIILQGIQKGTPRAPHPFEEQQVKLKEESQKALQGIRKDVAGIKQDELTRREKKDYVDQINKFGEGTKLGTKAEQREAALNYNRTVEEARAKGHRVAARLKRETVMLEDFWGPSNLTAQIPVHVVDEVNAAVAKIQKDHPKDQAARVKKLKELKADYESLYKDK